VPRLELGLAGQEGVRGPQLPCELEPLRVDVHREDARRARDLRRHDGRQADGARAEDGELLPRFEPERLKHRARAG
jgi:hypothetical protein